MCNQPYLGCREFACAFRLVENLNAEPEPIRETKDFGWILYDLDYSDPVDPKPRFFPARLNNGVVNVPPWKSRGGARMILQSLSNYYDRKRQLDRIVFHPSASRKTRFHSSLCSIQTEVLSIWRIGVKAKAGANMARRYSCPRVRIGLALTPGKPLSFFGIILVMFLDCLRR